MFGYYSFEIWRVWLAVESRERWGEGFLEFSSIDFQEKDSEVHSTTKKSGARRLLATTISLMLVMSALVGITQASSAAAKGWTVDCATSEPVVTTTPSPLALGFDEEASLVLNSNCSTFRTGQTTTWRLQLSNGNGEYEVYSDQGLVSSASPIIVTPTVTYKIKNKSGSESPLTWVPLWVQQDLNIMPDINYTSLPAPTTTPGYIKIGCVLEYDNDEEGLAGKFAAYKSFTYFKKDSPGGSYVSWDKTFSVNPLPANSITYLEIDQASCAPGTSWGAGTKKVTDFRLDPQYGVQITNGDGTAITPQDIDAPQWNLNNDRTLTPFKVLRGLQNGVLKTSFILTWAAETYDYNIFNIWPIYTETSANTANQPLDFLSLRSVGSALYFNVAYEPPAAPKPSSPTELTVETVTDTTATVSWVASTSNSVTGYRVQTYSPTGDLVAGKTCTTASSTELSCTIEGLTSTTGYVFKVFALSADGESLPSTESSLVYLTGKGPGSEITLSETSDVTPEVVAGETTVAQYFANVAVDWSVVPGLDHSLFSISANDGTLSFGQNAVAGVYQVLIRATEAGNLNGKFSIFLITVTVSGEGGDGTDNENSPRPIRPPTQTNPTPTINLPSSGGSTGGVGTASTQPGQVFTLTGSGMNNVNTVNVGSQKAVITLKTATKLGFKIPKNLPAGLHDLSLYGSFGSMTEAKFFSIAKKKIKTRALGFAGNSPALSAAQKSEMSIFLNKLPGKVTLICNGSTSSPTVTAFDRKLARDRATKACDYARELNPTLQTEIRITPAAGVGYKYRSVKLTLKNY